jgi:uncharacterized protein (TIGR02246 family)
VTEGQKQLSDDEQAIRDVVRTWMDATREGDIATVIGLMTDDVLFMTPRGEPFGKDEFRARSEKSRDVRIDATNDIQELHVTGDWAWMRSFLAISATPPDGEPVERSGYALTILRKGPDGRWRVARDANLVT